MMTSEDKPSLMDSRNTSGSNISPYNIQKSKTVTMKTGESNNYEHHDSAAIRGKKEVKVPSHAQSTK